MSRRDDDAGPPQGGTTGRWELVNNLGKPPDQRKWKRWSDVPLWYRTLDRFGLPTLLVLILLYGGYRISLYALGLWEQTQKATIVALERLTEKVDNLSEKVEANTRLDSERRAVDDDRRERSGK